jgi:hypothetical protein
MTWVRQTEPERHVCEGPNEGRIDDLWRCHCGKLLRRARRCDVCDYYGTHHSGQCAIGMSWRPARFWQRVRYRKSA